MNRLGIVVLLGMLLGGNLVAGEEVVKTISGSGGKNTRPFTVPDRWEIQWDAQGSIFQLYLHSADGAMIGVPANQQGSGKGSSYQPKAGEYYLQVNAIGDWSITIVKVSSEREVDSTPSKHRDQRLDVVASFSGAGGSSTRPFTVPDRWEIQWDAQGSIFQLYLYSADGAMIGVPANQQGSGKGSSYQPKAGEFYLQINALGEWSIDIVRVE